jgi:hypothetical protein
MHGCHLPGSEKSLVPCTLEKDGASFYFYYVMVIFGEKCSISVTLSLKPTLSYQNAPDVIGQDLVHEISLFFCL